MAIQGRGLPCSRCGVYFQTLESFDKHLPCQRPTRWKTPRFKEVEGEEPHASEGNFKEAEFGNSGGARWAGETTRDRVDSGLRTRRIRAILAEPATVEDKSIWKRFWEWLHQ